jgi:hypothetical protein
MLDDDPNLKVDVPQSIRPILSDSVRRRRAAKDPTPSGLLDAPKKRSNWVEGRPNADLVLVMLMAACRRL